MSKPAAFVCGGLLLVALLALVLAGCDGAPTGAGGDGGGDEQVNGNVADGERDETPADDPRTEIAEAQISIIKSDNTGLQATLAFGLPTIETVEEGGETWTRLRITGLDAAGDGDGCPEVPVYRCLIAIPQGAEVSLASVTPVQVDEMQMNLYPFQALRGEFSTDVDLYTDELPPPEVFITPPFTKDSDACGQDRLNPSEP